MNLYFKCQNCKIENRFQSDSTTRVEFAMKNGKTKQLNCNSCHKISTYHINQCYAKESKTLALLSGLIFLFGTIIGVYIIIEMIIKLKTTVGIILVAFGLLIPVWVYAIIRKEDRRRVVTFNRSYLNHSTK